MIRKIRIALFTSAISLAAIACNLLNTPTASPASIATPTPSHEPGPPLMPSLTPNPASLEFGDPYQITWQISLPGNEFSISGEFADRWLEL